MIEQLNLFTTSVFLPKSARQQYVDGHSYGTEWAEMYVTARLKQLGKILRRDGFRNSYKLRLWHVPGICFSMRARREE